MLKHRPSHATVVAYLALFVALGGAAYAATLPRNSVGTKQLKKSAVRSSDVKDGALLAKDFKAGQLPSGQPGAKGDKGDKGDPGSPAPAPSCGAGRTLLGAACVETALRPPATSWGSAQDACVLEAGRLPTFAELVALGNRVATEAHEWSDDWYVADGAQWAIAYSHEAEHAVLAVTTDLPFRCVFEAAV